MKKSIHGTVHLFVYYLFMETSVYLFIYLFIVYLFVYLCIYLFIYLNIYLFIYLFICVFIYLCIYLFFLFILRQRTWTNPELLPKALTVSSPTFTGSYGYKQYDFVKKQKHTYKTWKWGCFR